MFDVLELKYAGTINDNKSLAPLKFGVNFL